MKKAQAAMEFIMTYGWGILVVIIAIAALAYFGVLNPSRFLPSNCILFPGLACTDFSVGDNSITLILQNGFGKDITIQSFNVVNDAGGTVCQWGVNNINLKMGDGQQKSISLGQCTNGIIGSKFRGTVRITYSTSDGVTHTRDGSLTSQVENLCTYTFNAGTYTATPCFSHEEDYNPFWGSSLLTSDEGFPVTGDDEGIYNPDYIAMGFPNLGIPDATLVTGATFTFTHKERGLDPLNCKLVDTSPEFRHEIRCFDGTTWGPNGGAQNQIGVYSISPGYITNTFNIPSSCVLNGAGANKILIKVTFDPEINVCGNIDIDSAKVDVRI